MDNTNLYEYALHSLYKTFKSNKENLTCALKVDKAMSVPVFYSGDDNLILSSEIYSKSRYAILYEAERLVIRMFEQNNMPYEIGDVRCGDYKISFIREENSKKIGYILSLRSAEGLHWQELQETGVDEVKCVSLTIPKTDRETLKTITSEEERKSGGFVKYETLEDLFSLFGPEEFSVFMNYVKDFNERVKSLIGFDTVLIPSEEAINNFKSEKAKMLKETRQMCQSFLPKKIDPDQKKKLLYNYFERGLYKERGLYNVLVGNSDFAESFISSEWRFSIHKATGSLEQTGTVIGYIKSIEQLLNTIVGFSIDTEKTIRKKDSGEFIPFTSDNYSLIDTMLGSLIGFMRYYIDMYDVSSFVKRHITDTLDEYRVTCRNGYIHKDNLYDYPTIEKIREQTLYLYFLLLGGCSISDDKFELLGYHALNADAKAGSDEPQYSEFENWLSKILGFDSLDESKVIYFQLMPNYNNCTFSLQLATASKYEATGIDWASDISYPFANDAYTWHLNCTTEDAQKRIIAFINRYIEDGCMSHKLKNCIAIVAGDNSNVEVVYGFQKT